MIDFHTHILPEMDDGSDSVDTSIKLLNLLEKDGVKLVCLTSHFYAKYESIDEYISRRDTAFKKLNYKGPLKLKLGAEIRFYHGISSSEDIDKLLLSDTKILLIELPFFEEITGNIIDEIVKLKLKGYDIVLAHIERYRLKKDLLEYLHNSGIKFQLNADTLCHYFSQKYALNLIKNHYIYCLGSDCHNLETRPPRFKEAVDIIKNKLKIDDISFYLKGIYNCN